MKRTVLIMGVVTLIAVVLGTYPLVGWMITGRPLSGRWW
jgi:hypothetical protein